MENASKALLIAGGILLVMLVIGLLLFSWTKFSEFYSKNDELAEIEDLTKFNLQFTNYQRNKVYGYEVISMANKIEDYNMRHAVGGKNDENYKAISMNIDLVSPDYLKQLCKDNTTNLLFTRNKYDINGITNIIKRAEEIENYYGSSNATTKIAKSIDSIILSDSQLEYNRNTRHMTDTQSYTYALDLFNKLTERNKIGNYKKNPSMLDADYSTMKNTLAGYNTSIIAYYEYYQFKRGIFECKESDITYDKVSGRVDSISFTFTGKIE